MLKKNKILYKSKLIQYRSDCRVCGSKNIKKIIDLGVMPLAGNFVKKKDLDKKEIRVSLKLYFCNVCKLVQVKDSINPEILFQAYNYSSSTISSLNNHFISYSKKIKNKFSNKKNVKILEFGCNDGILLKEFSKNKNFFCLGVDPSSNISSLAKKKGINIINKYFNKKTADEIFIKHGKFDYITASNVFAHIDDIHSVVEASKCLLKDKGQLVIEVHYLLDLINLNQYDFFYHEHLNYYTLKSLEYLFKLYELDITNIEKINVHGGSIRVTLQNSILNKKFKSTKVEKKLKIEKIVNLNYFKNFEKNILNQKNTMIKLLDKLTLEKKNIIGFGASGRGTTFLNYCGISKKYIKYIVDASPLRAGKYMPGLKIPIYNIDYLKKNAHKIDYILIIAWNYQNSIIKQVKKINKDIKFIIPFPYPNIL